MVALLDEGGLYLDIDAIIYEWDNEFIHYFDSIWWQDRYFLDDNVIQNYQQASSKGHPVIKTFIDKFRETHLAEIEGVNIPIHLRRCLKNTALITLYETGPFFATMAYLHSHDEDGR